MDPIVTPVTSPQSQVQVPSCIEFMKMFKDLQEVLPGMRSTCGLSNVSNAVPSENRPLINRTYGALLMGVGLKMMIANPMDEKLKEVIHIIEERDESTPVGRLYLKLHDRIAASEVPTVEDVDMGDPEQVAIWKTVQILLNKVIYADSYLQQATMA